MINVLKDDDSPSEYELSAAAINEEKLSVLNALPPGPLFTDAMLDVTVSVVIEFIALFFTMWGAPMMIAKNIGTKLIAILVTRECITTLKKIAIV